MIAATAIPRTVSLGGGTVRFVGVTLAPWSADGPGLSLCASAGRIEVLWGERVSEVFFVSEGELVAVTDGAEIAPGASVLHHHLLWLVRASLPPGVTARVSLAREEVLDGGTVTTTHRLALTVDEAVVSQCKLSLHRLHVADGDRVTDGAPLASEVHARFREDPSVDSCEALRDLLDARVPPHTVVSCAPEDGVVERVDRRTEIVRAPRGPFAREALVALWLRTPRGLRRVRLAPRQSLRVAEGSAVSAGEALQLGARSHHRLLRAIGAEDLAEHLLWELDAFSALRGAAVPSVYWSVVVRALLGWRRVLSPGSSPLRRNQVLSAESFARHVREAVARGDAPPRGTTVLRGLRALRRLGQSTSRAAGRDAADVPYEPSR